MEDCMHEFMHLKDSTNVKNSAKSNLEELATKNQVPNDINVTMLSRYFPTLPI